jgi:hypothetical protein
MTGSAQSYLKAVSMKAVDIVPTDNERLNSSSILDIIANNPIEQKVVELSFSQPYSLIEHSM